MSDDDFYISMPPMRTVKATMVFGDAVVVPVALAARLHDWVIEAANSNANHPEWRNAARDEQDALADAKVLWDLIEAANAAKETTC